MSHAEYSMAKVLAARALAEEGLGPCAIARELGVSHATACRWIDNAQLRKARRTNNRRAEAKRKEELKRRRLERMVAMRERGASWPAIAIAVQVYEGKTLCSSTVKNQVRAAAPHLPSKPRGVPYTGTAA